MVKKRKRNPITPEERARWKETERKLLERIRYHEAKLAEEGKSPDLGDTPPATPEELARIAQSQDRLLERIRYHEAKLAEERGENAKPA